MRGGVQDHSVLLHFSMINPMKNDQKMGGSEKLRKLSHSSDRKWHSLDLSIPIVLILKSHTRLGLTYWV